MQRIYLDYAATTPVLPEVLEAMVPYFSGEFGNASGSTVGLGQRGKPSTRQGIRWRRYLAHSPRK